MTRYYHGGLPGLQPGDVLLPPSQTGAEVSGIALWADAAVNPLAIRALVREREDRLRRSRGEYRSVCITEHEPYARAFARGTAYLTGRAAAVYEVDPLTPPDPWRPREHRCGSARVTRVVHAAVTAAGQRYDPPPRGRTAGQRQCSRILALLMHRWELAAPAALKVMETELGGTVRAAAEQMPLPVVLDFDGVLAPGPDGPTLKVYDPASIDAQLIRDLQAGGYAVAISTCGHVPRIADALRAAGVPCFADVEMRAVLWRDRRVVLVTNRKVRGIVFDDLAVSWSYGRPALDLVRAAERAIGYCYCPGPAWRHWGPDGPRA